jgi:hypothetical protein
LCSGQKQGWRNGTRKILCIRQQSDTIGLFFVLAAQGRVTAVRGTGVVIITSHNRIQAAAARGAVTLIGRTGVAIGAQRAFIGGAVAVVIQAVTDLNAGLRGVTRRQAVTLASALAAAGQTAQTRHRQAQLDGSHGTTALDWATVCCGDTLQLAAA